MGEFELFLEEHQKYEEGLRYEREKNQLEKKDFNEEMEKCECGAYLNSHDHCPRCDY